MNKRTTIARVAMTLLFAVCATTMWATKYITDVMVVGAYYEKDVNSTKKKYTDKGWTAIDKDLNDNVSAFSDYIYLLYKSDEESNIDASFITGFYISNTYKSSIKYNDRTYYPVSYDGSDHFKDVKGNLNSNTSGKDIYLYYTKDPFENGNAVSNISFSDKSSGAVGLDGGSGGYDLNTGAGAASDDIYLHFSASKPTYVPDPFVINSLDDWNKLAKLVNEGKESFYGKTIELGADISNIQVMVGNSNHPFKGDFNGNGKTIDVAYSGIVDGIAPFHYVDNVIIENLNVTGIIMPMWNTKHSAGLLGMCSGFNQIYNCKVSVNIALLADMTSPAEGYAGGIVGHGGNGTLIMEKCIFDGNISNFSKYAGGLLGWCNDVKLTMGNCLFKGTFTPIKGGKYHPIACKWNEAKSASATVFDTYYLNTIDPGDLGDNFLLGTEGTPISKNFVDGEWDTTVKAADGNTYYTRHVTPIEMPYSYGFENGMNGWRVWSLEATSGIKTDEKKSGTYSFKFEECNHNQHLISPEITSPTARVEMSFKFKGTANKSVSFQIGTSSTTNDINAFTWSDPNSVTTSNWSEVKATIGAGVKYVAIRYIGSSSAMYVDDFVFEAPYQAPVTLALSEWTEDGATFNWEAPNSYVQKYFYQYREKDTEEWIATGETTETTMTITGLKNNTAYEFKVAAVYEGDEKSYFMTAEFTFKAQYLVPANITASEWTADAITFNWEAPKSTVQKYFYQYKEKDAEEWIATGETTQTTVTLTGLNPQTDYEFRLAAVYNEEEKSAFVIVAFTTKNQIVSLPYEYSFENGMGYWSLGKGADNSGAKADAKHQGNNGFLFGKTDHQQYLISPQIKSDGPMKVTFWFKNADSNNPAYFYVCCATDLTTNDIKSSSRVTASDGIWKQGVVHCPEEAQFFVIVWDNSGGELCIDDFNFTLESAEEPKEPEEPEELEDSETPEGYMTAFNNAGYATYYNGESATTLPPGVEAYIVTGIGENGEPVYEKIADGDTENNTIPAGTAVVLSTKQTSSATGTEPTLAVLSLGGEDHRTFDNNLLHGSDEPTTTTGGETYYKMGSDDNGENSGWYQESENGEAFQSGAHQAWLAWPEKNSDDTPLTLPNQESKESTDIQTIQNPTANEEWYTLNGVKLDRKPTTKGIYICNGHKVVIK